MPYVIVGETKKWVKSHPEKKTFKHNDIPKTEVLGQFSAKKCPKVVKSNTRLDHSLRTKLIPNFTSFLENAPKWNPEKMKYLIIGEEICPKTGRKHWQGAAYFHEKVSYKTAQRLLGIGNSHIENIPQGTGNQAFDYCNKDGKYQEFGTRPQQGKRVDLIEIKDEIMQGKKVDEIVLENPMLYHQYGRTLMKIEELRLRQTFRTELTKGIWYYGSTGCGKSVKAFENYTPDTHYAVPNDNGWWDAYTQQETVIFNDFRGEVRYNDMLELVDYHPKTVKRRGREPLPFTSKLVIVTSSLSPDQVYKNRDEEDSLEQLYRRFEVINMTPNDNKKKVVKKKEYDLTGLDK